MPTNYPPAETKQRTLAGMNTPDLKGSYGIFNFYTNAPASIVQEAGGGGRVHDVYVIGNRVEARLPGPINTFRTDAPETTIDFQVFIDPQSPVAKIRIQGNEFILKEKEWSGWMRVRFNLIPTQSVTGICLFYLKEVRPKFKLYVSPINIDPARPALPLSTPESYARELEKRFGPYFTKGLPADTSALENGVLDEAEFLELDDMVYEESLAMLEYELGRFDEGLLFFYFSNTDQRQHMFWRLTDPDHPAYDEALARHFGGVIDQVYTRDGPDPRPGPAQGRQGYGRPGHVRPRLQHLPPRLQPQHLAPPERLPPLEAALEAGGIGPLRQHRLVEVAGLRRRAQRPLHQRIRPGARGHRQARDRTRKTSSARSPAGSSP